MEPEYLADEIRSSADRIEIAEEKNDGSTLILHVEIEDDEDRDDARDHVVALYGDHGDVDSIDLVETDETADWRAVIRVDGRGLWRAR